MLNILTEGHLLPKTQVQYQPGRGDKVCANCRFFERTGPAQCTKVIGIIKPDMYCVLFKPQRTVQNGHPSPQ
jgi:hypothetical protein